MSGQNTYGRIWRTASGGYVGDGHLDAEILVAGPADPLPDDFDPETFGATVAAVVEDEPEVVEFEVGEFEVGEFEVGEDERQDDASPGVQAEDDTSGLSPAIEKPAAKRGRK